MATTITKPMSEAEAYLAEGAREISERLQDLILRSRPARPHGRPRLIRAAVAHPVAATAALVVGAAVAILVAGVAGRLAGQAR